MVKTNGIKVVHIEMDKTIPDKSLRYHPQTMAI